MRKPMKEYIVTLRSVLSDSDDGRIISSYEIGTFKTRAVSAAKAECNARHRSGIPYHGWADYDSGRWFKEIEADVVEVGGDAE